MRKRSSKKINFVQLLAFMYLDLKRKKNVNSPCFLSTILHSSILYPNGFKQVHDHFHCDIILCTHSLTGDPCVLPTNRLVKLTKTKIYHFFPEMGPRIPYKKIVFCFLLSNALAKVSGCEHNLHCTTNIKMTEQNTADLLYMT